MSTEPKPPGQYSIGDAHKEAAFLTFGDGYDKASLVRYLPPEIACPDHRKALLDDAQWQQLINLVDAAPDLLEALIEAREVLAVALSWPGSESLRSKINVAIMKTEAAQRVPERRHVGDYELYDRGCPDCP